MLLPNSSLLLDFGWCYLFWVCSILCVHLWIWVCLHHLIPSSSCLYHPLEMSNFPNNPALLSPPLRVYDHWQLHPSLPQPTIDGLTDSHPEPTLPVPPPEPYLPIALWKGVHSTRNPSPHNVTLSYYHCLSSLYYTYLSSLCPCLFLYRLMKKPRRCLFINLAWSLLGLTYFHTYSSITW